MGNSRSKPTILESFDDLPPDIFQHYVEKSKHIINDQYDSNESQIHFPTWGNCRIHLDLGPSYYITSTKHKKLDKELELHCKELIQRPYIIIGRTVHLVENYN